jgi:hypothetical protein
VRVLLSLALKKNSYENLPSSLTSPHSNDADDLPSTSEAYCTDSPSSSYRTPARNEVSSNRTVKVKATKSAVIFEDKPKDEPPAKKSKGRKTFNSACAADDLALFAPFHDANLTPSVAGSSSLIGSPLTSLSDSSNSPSPSPKAITNKKRKLEEIDNDDDLEFTEVKEKRKIQPVNSEWEPVTESYSRQMIHNKWQYRCTACFKEAGRDHLCTREGDMQRHLQTLRHTPKSFFCSNSGCSRSFTREDALTRHMIKCRF